MSTEQATKKRKGLSRTVSLPKLSNEVSSLRRTVNASKPELRQASYPLTIALNSTVPTPLIDPTLIDAGTEEIRLHRVTVNWIYTIGDYPWGIIYAPRQGYQDNQIPDGANPYSVTNFLRHLDATKQRIFARKNFGKEIATGADGDSILEMDKKFSIPMKVGMVNPGTKTVNHNQLFWIGGNWAADAPRVIEVTVWYTSA